MDTTFTLAIAIGATAIAVIGSLLYWICNRQVPEPVQQQRSSGHHQYHHHVPYGNPTKAVNYTLCGRTRHDVKIEHGTPSNNASNKVLIVVDAAQRCHGGYCIQGGPGDITCRYYSENHDFIKDAPDFEERNIKFALNLWSGIFTRKDVTLLSDSTAAIKNLKRKSQMVNEVYIKSKCQSLYIEHRSRGDCDEEKLVPPADSLSRSDVDKFKSQIKAMYSKETKVLFINELEENRSMPKF